jgi:hypothetical protein
MTRQLRRPLLYGTLTSLLLVNSFGVVELATGADSGTSVSAPAPTPPSLNEKDLLPYKQKGHGTLTGQAFLSSPSGKAITQAGAPVHLIPVTAYTRYWFEHSVRTAQCPPVSDTSGTDTPPTTRTASDCARAAIERLQSDKRLLPAIRTTRANPTGHFWFSKIPAGRYYVVSLIEGGAGSHQDERAVGMAWLLLELEAGEKATNLVVTDCKGTLC